MNIELGKQPSLNKRKCLIKIYDNDECVPIQHTINTKCMTRFVVAVYKKLCFSL